MEIWRLEHPDLGLIGAHIGPAEELVELDPDFPVTTGKDGAPEKAGDIDKPAEVVDVGTVELEQRLRQLGADGIARQILITRDGAPVARLKNLNNTRVGFARQVPHAGRRHGVAVSFRGRAALTTFQQLPEPECGRRCGRPGQRPA